MNISFFLTETSTNGYWVEALGLISFASILCGILVVICKNPIRSVLFLIGLFVSIACYLVLLGLDFLGIAYLLVYVGAVIECMVILARYNLAAWVEVPLYEVFLIIINWFDSLLILNKYISPETVLALMLQTKKLSSAPSVMYISQIIMQGLATSLARKKYEYSCLLSAKIKGKLYSTLPCSFSLHQQDTEFIKWFVGFSDAESNFNVVLYKNKDGIITSAAFRFLIELHIDDIEALKIIKSKLNIGNDIAVYGNSCKFTVTHPKDIYKLLDIFDKYNLNTAKYLDYICFKKAFNLYQESDKSIKEKQALLGQILDIKNGMNSNRTNFNISALQGLTSMPCKEALLLEAKDHQIIISDSWLLGFIEGDGSFYLSRKEFEPSFSITQSVTQLFLLERIKDYLENNLGFDKYSMFKLKGSSIIAIQRGKAVNNSKPLVTLRIKNTNVLVNYLIPYLDKRTFITKKAKDFNDFKIICTAIYNSTYRIEQIKFLILKLSYTMNNYRLSTNSDPEKVDFLSEENIDMIINAKPTIRHLDDGRQLDIVTGKAVNRRWTNCVYEIIKDTGEIILASTLNDAADIIGVNFRTIARHLESEYLFSSGHYAIINAFKIRRVPVFYR